MAQSPLLQSGIARVEIDPLHRVTVDRQIRTSRNILQKPPGRPRGRYHAGKFRKHGSAVAARRGSARPRKIRTRRAADDTRKFSRRRHEAANVAAENQIRPAHDAIPRAFETGSQKIYSWEKRKHQATGREICSAISQGGAIIEQQGKRCLGLHRRSVERFAPPGPRNRSQGFILAARSSFRRRLPHLSGRLWVARCRLGNGRV